MKRKASKIIAAALLLALAVTVFSAGALADDVLYCRICGRQIPTDSNFCPYCGEAVIALPDASGGTAARESGAISPVLAELIANIKTAAETPAVAEKESAAEEVPEPIPGPFNTTWTGSAFTYPQVYVTKSPTSESVPYGGSAIFIARAEYDTAITWYIANSDASIIYNVSDAPRYINGLVVYGQGTETLTLCEIPSWMNGWQVQACFSGEGGPVYSGVAYIWTYQITEPVFYYEPPVNEVCRHPSSPPPPPPCP